MRRKFNVIQINGFRGLLMAIGIVVCLIAGFGAFPGLVLKSVWNLFAGATNLVPQISMLQGVLLWGIVVVAYFTFKKNGFLVEFKSGTDLSRDEMDAVMERIKRDRQSDILTKALLHSKEIEDKFIKEESLKKEKEISNHENMS